MNDLAPAEAVETESFEELISEIGKLLAQEYITLMKKGESNERSDLRPVLEREPAAGEHRGPSPSL